MLLGMVVLALAAGTWLTDYTPAGATRLPNGMPALSKSGPAQILDRTTNSAARVSAAPEGSLAELLPADIDGNGAEPPVDVPDSIKYDNGPYYVIRWPGSSKYYAAVRFTPAVNCTLKQVKFYQGRVNYPAFAWDTVYVHDAGTSSAPGARLASIAYSTSGTGWKTVTLPTPLVRTSGVDFWAVVSSHTDSFTLGSDNLTPTPSREYWSNDNATWTAWQYNFCIRAMIASAPASSDMGATAVTCVTSPQRPNQWITIGATVKNYGTAPVSAGVPVKMAIVYPSGSVGYTDVDQVTATTLAPNGTEQITFSPNWRIPATAGNYVIKVFTDMSGEGNRGNDTARYTLEVSNWLTYADWNNGYWITWDTPMRGTLVFAEDFGVSYPLTVESLKHEFFLPGAISVGGQFVPVQDLHRAAAQRALLYVAYPRSRSARTAVGSDGQAPADVAAGREQRAVCRGDRPGQPLRFTDVLHRQRLAEPQYRGQPESVVLVEPRRVPQFGLRLLDRAG